MTASPEQRAIVQKAPQLHPSAGCPSLWSRLKARHPLLKPTLDLIRCLAFIAGSAYVLVALAYRALPPA